MFKKVLLAEDHQSVKLSLAQTLASLGIDAGNNYAYDCDSALIRIKNAIQENTPYDLLITDLSFDEEEGKQLITSGIELIKAVKGLQPNLKILVFSAESNAGIVNKLFDDQDINGYVRKSRSDTEELKKAVEAIYQGRKYISPNLQQAVRTRNAHDFTTYDITIISQLAKGTLQKNIPDYLQKTNIKPWGLSSVEKRLNYIRETLNISSNEQLVAFCKDKKII
jgi:two-component system capsular synthesis response regulator RcsB